jgi:hypothetical protein
MLRVSVLLVLVFTVACANDDATGDAVGGQGGGFAQEGGSGGSTTGTAGGFSGTGGNAPSSTGGASAAGAGGKTPDAGIAAMMDAAPDVAVVKPDAATPADAGNPVAQLPPTNRKDIEAWIAKGYYKTWKCETQVMNARPNGAHGRNRVCSNDLASTNGAGNYPVGAASIKELYSNNSLNGYAAAVKVKAGTGANTWYWYEGGIEGVGNPSCAGCHSLVQNYGGHDYVYIQVK